MPQEMKDRIDPDVLSALEADFAPWPLPHGDGIDGRWIDSYISTRLCDVMARRYYNVPFPRLSVGDRTVIRGRVEFFVQSMTRVLGEER